jgi:uncharacterized protein YjbI with pentapeptide repeats
MLPIPLGGRTFLRFDDVVVGALVNRYRFPFLYYEAFLELVKLGVIIPAFDGFEEMFIQSSSGEALSALGNLMSSLDSSGSVLIAARKAYFEYKSFATQAKLFDAIGSDQVAFSRLSLQRWDRNQFITYASKRGVDDPSDVYDDVAHRLGTAHPLLTRAVLVKRLLDVAAQVEGRTELLQSFGSSPHDYFYQFVDAIIEREALEKWIDRSGDPAQPLLTVDQHHQLLSLVAQEMWMTSTQVLKDEMLDILSDLFADQHRMPALMARQIKERLKQHSLITSANSSRTLFSFDHEEFRNFFLGQAIGRRIQEGAEAELRTILRIGPIPGDTFDSAVQYLRRVAANLREAVLRLQTIARADMPASFTRENAGGLAARMFDVDPAALVGCVFSHIAFPPDSLRGRTISGVSFETCNFQPTSLENSSLDGCSFERCTFENLEFYPSTEIADVVITSCEIYSVSPPDRDGRVFGPEEIVVQLLSLGFTLDGSDERYESAKASQALDDNMLVVDRAFRAFLRNTHVNENVFKQRLGVRSNHFLDSILPSLLRVGVLDEVLYTGGGNQRRFRLRVPMMDVETAMVRSRGNYEAFLQFFDPAN